MQTFVYQAKDKSGKTVKAEVQAQSEKDAVKLLQAQELLPLSVSIKGQENNLLGKYKNRIKSDDKILFTRQLSTLISAGLPIAQGLRTVQNQIENPRFSSMVESIVASVEGGSTLADSLAKNPKVFNKVYVSLVAAGESSGTLDETLVRLANQQEKDHAINRKIRGALIYPAIVLVVILAVLVFMLVGVLPQVTSIYTDLGEDLPFTTKALLAMSEFIISFWWVMIVGTAAAIYAGIGYFRSESGMRVADKIKMKIPLFGPLFQMLYMARFTRTGATLMRSGVQMLDMLNITGESVNNIHVKEAVDAAAAKVKGGKALSVSLQDQEVFLSLVPQMISIGEQSGALDEMMAKAATYYEDELENKINNISTIIEPVLMVIMGVMAAVVVGAILLPIYGLVGKSF